MRGVQAAPDREPLSSHYGAFDFGPEVRRQAFVGISEIAVDANNPARTAVGEVGLAGKIDGVLLEPDPKACIADRRHISGVMSAERIRRFARPRPSAESSWPSTVQRRTAVFHGPHLMENRNGLIVGAVTTCASGACRALGGTS
jgi:hypothetical protein